MIQSKNLIGKSVVFGWEWYKNCCLDSFVLDEENQINLLEKVLCSIRQRDNECKLYVSTYPIEIKASGYSAYSEMIWITTKLSCDDLEKIFSKYLDRKNNLMYHLYYKE